MYRKKLTTILAILTIAALATGCATRKFVREEIQGTNSRTDALETQTETQIEHLQTRVDSTDARVAENDEEIEAASKTALQALDRAVQAGKLAEGKLLYETTLVAGDLGFGFEKAELGDETKATLDQLAERLKQENQNVYLEIQGHTDSSGPEEYNMQLGQDRADSVSRYLNMEHGLPLHRMATISYGETAPAFDNNSRDGRAQNRRVVVVVLR
jgi:outer membrane protein OmpA-like peptidoglycan-associated protein